MSAGADESGGMGGALGPERFSPGALTLENAAEKMREGGGRIQRGGNVVMDMAANSHECDSAALGAMIEWLRQGAERSCEVRFENIEGRLEKLARLYQVADLFGLPKSNGAAK